MTMIEPCRVTVITPTCDRPCGVSFAERWMRRQTRPPDEWIVADGGEPAAVCTMGQRHLHVPQLPGPKNFTDNLLRACAAATGDILVIWEDDDWYAPTHLAQVVAQLSAPGILAAGDDRQRYYHVGARRWRIYQNRGAALCQTAFRRELLPHFQKVLEQCRAAEQYGVDARFWAQLPVRQKRLEHTATVVGIKGLPGRQGLGVGHRQKVVETWTPDPEWLTLRSWIGADAEAYASCAQPMRDVPPPVPAPAVVVGSPRATIVVRAASGAAPNAPPGEPVLPPASPTRPRLVAVYFGADAQWGRLARVLDAGVRQHCPTWTSEVQAILPPAPRSLGSSASFITNTQKLDVWAARVHAAADGECLALLDVDTMILRPLDPIWQQPFDLAYTTRPAGCRYPLNAGVIFVRVNARSRMFMERWADENRLMLRDRGRHEPWRRRYGGMNQAAFGAVVESATGHQTDLRAIPCQEWNCEETTWHQFRSDVTRILHVKSALRLAVFRLAPAPHLKSLVQLWLRAERAALGAA